MFDKIRSFMLMPLKWYYIILLLFIIIIALYIFYSEIENYFIFYPQKSFDYMPDEYHLNYRDVYFITNDNIQLHGWFFPKENEKPVLIFCHGNAGNISHRIDNIKLLVERGFQVFIFDYRGYGKSSGSPSEEGIYRDGRAAYDYLVNIEKVSPEKIILFGRSLGGSVAIDVSLKRDVRSIIIESAFLSTREMAKKMFPFSLISPLLPVNYNNIEKIPDISVPKLIIHGEDDSIVPFYMGKRLYESAKEPKFFFPIKGAGHNDTYVKGGVKYFNALDAFIRDSRI